MAMVARGEQEHQRRRAHRHLRLAPPRSTRSASTTSSAAAPTTTPATSSTSRATPAPACTPGPSSKAGSTKQQLKNFRQELQPGGGLSQLPAPVADARLLAVPDRQHGPRADHGDLPGPVQPLPARPAAWPTADGTHVWAFLGDGECDEPEIARLHRPRRPREARQPDLRHQLQPAAARRPGPRQRQDHPGTRRHRSAGPGGTSSRCIWGSDWDALLAHDHTGALARRMMEVLDGEYQEYVGRDMRTPRGRNKVLITRRRTSSAAGRSSARTSSTRRSSRRSSSDLPNARLAGAEARRARPDQGVSPPTGRPSSTRGSRRSSWSRP